MSQTTPNPRTLLQLQSVPADGTSPSYADYCREERNFAALLYAELLRPESLQRFLRLIDGIGEVPNLHEAEVFFEYAHARDLWHSFGKQSDRKNKTALASRNEAYRQAIGQLIGAPPELLESMQEAKAFNAFFMGRRDRDKEVSIGRRVSESEIQMPNQWDQRRFPDWVRSLDRGDGISDNAAGIAFAQRICRLKWAFNAKADLVIHLPDLRAICVEIKVASGESKYSIGPFEDPKVERYTNSQTEQQRYVMTELLGYDTQFVFLTPSGGPASDKAHSADADKQKSDPPIQHLTWSRVRDELFAEAGKPEELLFVRRMLNSNALAPKRSTKGT